MAHARHSSGIQHTQQLIMDGDQCQLGPRLAFESAGTSNDWFLLFDHVRALYFQVGYSHVMYTRAISYNASVYRCFPYYGRSGFNLYVFMAYVVAIFAILRATQTTILTSVAAVGQPSPETPVFELCLVRGAHRTHFPVSSQDCTSSTKIRTVSMLTDANFKIRSIIENPTTFDRKPHPTHKREPFTRGVGGGAPGGGGGGPPCAVSR